MLKKIFIVAILFCAALTLSSCLQPSPPKAEFLEYKVREVTTSGVNVDFYFNVENPNPLPIDVSQYSYKIYINDREFISKVKSGFNLPANGKKLVKMPVFLGYTQIFGSLLAVAEAIAKGEDNIRYRIEGSVSAGTMGVLVHTPIQAEGTIPIPKDIKF
jgi:LEA14-like dessication related protein